MTQVDAFLVEDQQNKSKKTEKSSSSSNELSMSFETNRSIPTSSSPKSIRIYQNGHISNLCRPVFLNPNKSHSWCEILELLQQAASVPVQKVFTIHGKRISSWTEVQKLQEVVVCGTERFKMLPYGKDSPNSSNNSTTTVMAKSRNSLVHSKEKKVEKRNLVKSVIVEPTCMTENENSPSLVTINPLLKTLSEQDVSAMEKCSRVRARQSSPRPRPVSAYNHHVNMTASGERKTLGLGASRIPIPKRVSTPLSGSTCVQNNSANTTPKTTDFPNNVIKPRRITDKPPETLRQDSSKNEFIRPRLVTIIRHGMKPRKAVRFLLNKKTARSYDQVLNELTESIKPAWGAVRKVYTISRSEVTCLEDFFGEDDIFLACPNDRLGTNDFDLDFEECKSIQPYVKGFIAFKQARFEGLEASRSPLHQRRPKSCSNSQGHSSSQYPAHPKYIPVTHFPAAILDKYHVGDIIGDGNFAVVRECTARQSKQRFALKVIDKAQCKGRDAPPEHEVKILSMVNHQNIVKMFEQFDFSNELYIVLELIEGGDLFDAIAAATKFTEEESASMTRDVASALAFLHSFRIVHRDIKPENLLVYTQNDGQRRIKLGDFGLAKIADGPLYTVCGTPTYVAPEILEESGYGLKVDIWALGVIVYVLLCGYPPFVSPTGKQEDLFELILAGEYDFPDDPWENISHQAKDIIQRMIDRDTDMRPSAEEVLLHPWLGDTSEPSGQEHHQSSDLSFKIFQAMGLTSPLSLSQSHS